MIHAHQQKAVLVARASTVAAAALCMLVASPAQAQDDARGFYFRVSTGLARAWSLPSVLTSVSNPTKCDSLLYTSPALAPSGAPECLDSTPRPLLSSDYSPGPGFASSLAAGYDFDRLRVEFEYRARAQGGDSQFVGGDSRNPAVLSKANEWSPVLPPTDTIANFRSHQFFANVYYDFSNDSAWTPFVGAGGGMARTSVDYERRSLRKTLAQGYQDVEPPLTIADRPAAAAGTLSVLESRVTGSTPGFQTLAGIEYELGAGTSIGIIAQWTRVGGITKDIAWSVVRSHRSVRADGVAPFVTELMLDGFAYWAVTLGMRHRF